MKERKTDIRLVAIERALSQTITAAGGIPRRQGAPNFDPNVWRGPMMRAFDRLRPAAADRVLFAMFERCAALGVAPSADMIERLRHQFLSKAGRGARDAPRDRGKMLAAAAYEAAHPGASLSEIAKQAAVSKNTISVWRRSEEGEYRKLLQDQAALLRFDAQFILSAMATRHPKEGMQDGK